MDTARNDSDIIEIDLREVFGLLLHYIWLILICAVVAGTAGLLVSKFAIDETFESNTKIVVLSKQNNDTITYNDMQLNSQLTKDYVELIKSRYVLETVMETCGVSEEETYEGFAGRVEVENLTNTRIISITVTDKDPQMAKQLADEIRTVASKRIKEVLDLEAVNVVDEANLPTEKSGPSVKMWTLAGGLLGAFLCIAILLVRYLLDDTIKTSDDVERYLGLSTLAMIPVKDEELKKKTKRKKGKNKSRSSSDMRPLNLTVEDLDDTREEEA